MTEFSFFGLTKMEFTWVLISFFVHAGRLNGAGNMVFGNEWKVRTLRSSTHYQLSTALCKDWYIVNIYQNITRVGFFPGVIRTLKCPIQFIIDCLCCSSLYWPSQGLRLLTSFHVNKAMIMSYSTGTQHTFFFALQGLIIHNSWYHAE